MYEKKECRICKKDFGALPNDEILLCSNCLDVIFKAKFSGLNAAQIRESIAKGVEKETGEAYINHVRDISYLLKEMEDRYKKRISKLDYDDYSSYEKYLIDLYEKFKSLVPETNNFAYDIAQVLYEAIKRGDLSFKITRLNTNDEVVGASYDEKVTEYPDAFECDGSGGMAYLSAWADTERESADKDYPTENILVSFIDPKGER